MKIKHIKLENYRNLNSLHLNFDSKGALIYGRNGIGKTNLLEAITYFSLGRSFKRVSDKQIIQFQKNFLRVKSLFLDDDVNRTLLLELTLKKGAKKVINCNFSLVDRVSKLYGLIYIIYFSSLDILLINGTPSVRREFFDRSISQINPTYLLTLIKYYRILAQRNTILKRGYNIREKTLWDEQFINVSIKIIKDRIEYIKMFKSILHNFDYLFEKKVLNLKYKHSFRLNKILGLKDSMFKHLKDIETREYAHKTSLVGVHLDDIVFFFKGKSAKYFASQGEKRKLVIVYKMTQEKILQKKMRQKPILIFDDIFAELDKNNSLQLLKAFSGKNQIFVAVPEKTSLFSTLNIPLINLEKMVV